MPNTSSNTSSNTSIPGISLDRDSSLVRWWRRLTSVERPPAAPAVTGSATRPLAAMPLAVTSRGDVMPAGVPPVAETGVAARPARARPHAGDRADERDPDCTTGDYLTGRPDDGADDRADDRAGAILHRLRLAVLITDAHGVATFANDAAVALLGLGTREAARGRPWDRLLRLSGEQVAGVRARLRLPGVTDGPMPASLETAAGRSLRAQLDIQPHPHDPARRLWILYDTWDAPDPGAAASDAGNDDGPFEALIGRAPVMRLIVKQIRDVAPVDVAVVVEGETGTGKELVARAIHRASGRCDRPFVAVNCAGLTESLLGSQLFGHRRGAFTGAIADQTGLFEAAHGGTLFLDEIGDMPLSMQTSLLRALQEREIVRLGESRPRPIDVRVIAATHHNLEQDVAQGRFRRDLFYRIRVAQIVLPPLRQRREDIPALASAFLRQFLAASRRPRVEIGRQAMEALCAHDWPGNVRELRSAIESAALMARDALIRPADLVSIHARGVAAAAAAPLSLDADDVDAIDLALKRTGGNRAEAARLLGFSRSTFYRRLAARAQAQAGHAN